jgi:hypothetical protein
MPTRDRLTRSQVADLLDVPPLFVSYPPDEGAEEVFSVTAVLIIAIGRELLGALEPWEVVHVAEHLWKWKPTSPWGWLVIYDAIRQKLCIPLTRMLPT